MERVQGNERRRRESAAMQAAQSDWPMEITCAQCGASARLYPYLPSRAEQGGRPSAVCPNCSAPHVALIEEGLRARALADGFILNGAGRLSTVA
jgi:hypothetical protein